MYCVHVYFMCMHKENDYINKHIYVYIIYIVTIDSKRIYKVISFFLCYIKEHTSLALQLREFEVIFPIFTYINWFGKVKLNLNVQHAGNHHL